MTKQKRKRSARRRKRQTKQRSAAVASPSSVEADLTAALNFQRQGDLERAKQLYCRILQSHPEQPDAWHLLGMTMHMAGQSEAALECLTKAEAIVPKSPELLSNLGVVFRAAGDLEQAKRRLEVAVQLQPQHMQARNNLGVILLEMRDHVAAEQQFRDVLASNPEDESVRANLGNALKGQGRLEEAQHVYEDILSRQPSHLTTLNNLGDTLRSRRRLEEAEQVLRRAALLDPGSEQAVTNWARVLIDLDQAEEAVECLHKLVCRNPQNAAAHHYLGCALKKLDRFAAAERWCRAALELDRNYALAHTTLGILLQQTGDVEGALFHMRQALAIRPDMHEAHSGLLFILSGLTEANPEELFAEHVRWGQIHGIRDTVFDHPPRRRVEKSRLRIGYISPDLCSHAVATFFSPVLAAHRSGDVETYCYAEVPREDATTERLRAMADHWSSTCGYSDQQVAEQIYEDEIDILVDLAGHTAGNRLRAFSYRPAPVQVTWLGYPNTTGSPAIDYRLTSEIQDPRGQESYHTEELVRLPFGTNCYEPPTTAPDVQPGPAQKRGYVTFGSLHRPQKISPEVLVLWARVLEATPGSRLLMYNTRFTEPLKKHYREQLALLGIDQQRIDIESDGDVIDYAHLNIYHNIDIGLDVFPWNGGTTTREALWMGVAVLGLCGKQRSARGTAATLHYAGLEDLVVQTVNEYVQRAQELASDLPRLADLRRNLRAQMLATICDADRFTRSLEAEYQAMWSRWCQLVESAD